MAAAPAPRLNTDFILDGSPEVRRLSEQYLHLRDIFDHTELLPPAIDTSRLHRVLDVGAGTGVWALDLADVPTVRPRLAPSSKNPLEIHICDISTSRFPPPEILRPLGIQAFQQDATEPFPKALHGTFDLVHMSSLGYTLNESQWKLALRNVRDVLKPGGYLVLLECDPISYTPARPPPAEGQPHDVSAVMNGSSVVHKINCVLTGLALKNKFFIDLSYRLPSLLQAAGLQPIAKERAICPFGAFCNIYTGLRGTPLYAMKSSSTEFFCGLLDSATKMLLRRGCLEAPLGAHIRTEEERRALSREFRHAVSDGVLLVASEWVAQRPTRRT